MKCIQSLLRKKITLIELQEYLGIEDYLALSNMVQQLVNEGMLEPNKSSGLNGKRPPLYQSYRIIQKTYDYSAYQNELLYLLPVLSNDYYLKHLDVYEKDRDMVLQMERYLRNSRECLNNSMSCNERSFEIFCREKFLLKEGGMRILKNLGWKIEDLNIYETTEPLAYYSHTKEIGQTMLIIENKDTFYSMRKHLMSGKDEIFGVKIGTLIYGGGKAIYKSFSDFDQCVETYMKAPENQILYFGDLDYEGILIYEQLALIAKEQFEIKPFIKAYETKLNKAKNINLPKTKEAQNRNCGSVFFSYFSENIQEHMHYILTSECYIPQEILHCGDF